MASPHRPRAPGGRGIYFAPLACSLATRIALYDANISATFNQVDLARRRTADDRDFLTLNPLGQVPTLRTETGDLLTENGAILQFVADSAPASGLAPTDRVGRAKLHRWLSFLGTELHKASSRCSSIARPLTR